MAHVIDTTPWMDASLPIEQRVEALLAQMTVAEKVGQTHMVSNVDPILDAEQLRAGSIGASLFASGATAGNVRDAGVLRGNINTAQRQAVEGSRLGIPVLFGRDVIHGHRTVFPIPLGLASAFDEDLVTRASAIAAAEAGATGVRWTFAPMVDLSEDPRWGRVAESFGEAPVLSGRLAAAAISGFQGREAGADEKLEVGAPERLAACAKHFVGYGLATGGRDYDTVSVGENTLRNLHLRPFQAAVEAGARTVMAAFNDVDGIPMHAHRHLLRDVLKGEWGFDGVVVADWDGVGQLVPQGVAADARDAARQAIEAGVDLDMVSGAYHAHLADLVRDGVVPIELLDDAVRRVLRLKFRLGLFDRPYVDEERDNAPSEATRLVAREAALAAHVLVANNGVLPLPADPGTVLLTGPFVTEGEALLGTWTLDGRPEDVVSPHTAFAERLGEALLVTDGRFSDQAVHLVRQADVTIALLGEHPCRSGEANSVSDLGLPAGQIEVLRQLAGIGKPLVAVVYTGRPLAIGEVVDLADAVIVAWHPGVEAGSALAALMFGDAQPVGRLPMTFPRSTGHVPTSTHQRPTGRPIPAEQDAGHGRYLDALVQPRFPFGFGLSYTRVTYGQPRLSAPVLDRSGRVMVEVEVANVGERPGREVVQLYFHDPVAEVTRPRVELVDWAAVWLRPGESRIVRFEVTAERFAYYGRDSRRRVDDGEIVLMVGPDAATLTPVPLTITSGACRGQREARRGSLNS